MTLNDKNPSQSGLKSVFRYLDLGFRLAISIFIGVYGGYWLDEKFSLTPLFLLLGLFVGAVSGFWTIYRAVFPPTQKKDENESSFE